MAKSVRTFRAIERWCGKSPDLGSNRLQMLWEEHGQDGVPFITAGAELLINVLDEEFSDRDLRLRAVDVIDLTVDGLIDVIPDVAAVVKLATAAKSPPLPIPEPPPVRTPLVVTLSDDSIERLAASIAALLTKKQQAEKKSQAKKKTARGGPKKSKNRKATSRRS